VWDHVVNPGKGSEVSTTPNGDFKRRNDRGTMSCGVKRWVKVMPRYRDFGGVHYAGQSLCVGLIEFLSSFGEMTSSTMHWHNIGRLRPSVEQKRRAE
jgi:hypothetical protein